MKNLVDDPGSLELKTHLRGELERFMGDAHDQFLKGTDYATWYDNDRRLIKTALGNVPC
ncbi:MAG: hypothetical protein ACLP07_03815 [Terracidiphilus sp.]